MYNLDLHVRRYLSCMVPQVFILLIVFAPPPKVFLTFYLIEVPFNTFANRADPDQAALVELPYQDLLCLLMENDTCGPSK